jgi:aspartate-semialdehyde dehydrogenase
MRGFRVGVVNPFSPFGKRVRELLQDRAYPTIELKLFDTRTKGGSALTQFQGEIVITQALDTDLFSHLDLIFFGGDESAPVADPATLAAREGALTIVHGAPDVDSPVVALGINDRRITEPASLVVAPRAPSILLGTVLSSLARSLEIQQASATVLLPASDKGEEAIQELHDQVVKILNFKPPPMEIFEEQLAFNLFLPTTTGKAAPLDARVGKESAELAGIGGRVAVNLVQAPVFHGYALSLWVRFADMVEPESVAKAFRASRRIKAPAAKRPVQSISPVSVAESNKIHVGSVRRDESSTSAFWIWAVADSLVLEPAAQAVQLAERVLGVSKSRS